MSGVARASSGTAAATSAVALDRALAGHRRRSRASPFVALDAGELGDPVEVDEVLEPGQPQREHRHEALAAGQHLGLVAVLGEQRDGVGDRLGRVVLERRRLHVVVPLSQHGT